jgi:hypothetical protein
VTRPSPSIPRWTAAIVFAALSFGHALVLPLFEGMDEPAHLSSVLQFATGQGRPEPDKARLNAAVERAIALAPGPYEQWQDLRTSIGATTYAEWRRLSGVEQERRLGELATLRVDIWQPGVRENWQAQHPPFFYALIGSLVRLFGDGSLLHAHRIARLASAAIFATTGLILTTFLTGRWGASPLAALFVSLFPMWYVMGARITNDALAIPALGLASLLMADQLRRPAREWRLLPWLGAGAAGAVALAAKAYGLVILPPAGVAAVVAAAQVMRARSASAIVSADARGATAHAEGKELARWFPVALPLLAAAIAVGVNAWWLIENQVNTGFLTGQNENADLMARGIASLSDRLPYLGRLVFEEPRVVVMTAARAATQALFVSNWTFGAAPAWFYPVQLFTLALAVAGVHRRLTPALRAAGIVAALTVGTIAAGSAKAVVDFYILFGETRLAQGWYVWGAGAAFAAALALAWDAAPRRAQRLTLVLQVACLLTAFTTDVMFWSGRYERHPVWRTPVLATGTPR